jgi:hypothetical protein
MQVNKFSRWLMWWKIDIWKINLGWRFSTILVIIIEREGLNWNLGAERDWKLKVKIIIGTWLEKNNYAWITLNGEHVIKRIISKSETGCLRNVW